MFGFEHTCTQESWKSHTRTDVSSMSVTQVQRVRVEFSILL